MAKEGGLPQGGPPPLYKVLLWIGGFLGVVFLAVMAWNFFLRGLEFLSQKAQAKFVELRPVFQVIADLMEVGVIVVQVLAGIGVAIYLLRLTYLIAGRKLRREIKRNGVIELAPLLVTLTAVTLIAWELTVLMVSIEITLWLIVSKILPPPKQRP